MLGGEGGIPLKWIGQHAHNKYIPVIIINQAVVIVKGLQTACHCERSTGSTAGHLRAKELISAKKSSS